MTVLQATVADWDGATRTGAVLLDDGTRVAFGATSLEGSGVRLLRSGQRVHLRVEAGEVVALTLLTMPLP
ncbi:hypothetical protein CLV35_0276 [Motilibacter peucedani]|uniref:Cold shock CspA family protein n=1 Tax=Motilibacter peucedani TaxID=598650 RepID=A0A420XUU5_9ACTN|nr:hypothetical protein [Motilibacter peucedani]RKS80605.1 hypothetical protein CLV35_0276 [Motilibacter peucedani]